MNIERFERALTKALDEGLASVNAARRVGQALAAAARPRPAAGPSPSLVKEAGEHAAHLRECSRATGNCGAGLGDGVQRAAAVSALRGLPRTNLLTRNAPPVCKSDDSPTPAQFAAADTAALRERLAE